jgi:hypothetical protein
MQEFQVTCINKHDRLSAHEHITHLGNSANRWRLTRESVIWRIDNKREAFYTVSPTTAQKSYVGVVREAGGKAPYLRCYADGKWNNNLLSLPECGGDFEIKS